MQYKNNRSLFRTTACGVAAFVFCLFVAAGTAPTAHPSSDKDAHDTEARLGLSFAQLKQRNLQAAYDNAARVIMLNPLSARGHALLGAAILAAGEFRLSVEEFKTALALDE